MKKKIDPAQADLFASKADFKRVLLKYGHSAEAAYREGGPEHRRARQRELARILKVRAECEALDRAELPRWKGLPIWTYNPVCRKTA